MSFPFGVKMINIEALGSDAGAGYTHSEGFQSYRSFHAGCGDFEGFPNPERHTSYSVPYGEVEWVGLVCPVLVLVEEVLYEVS